MATAVIAMLAALLGAAAAAWQWWQREPAATPLDAHWTGSAIALAGDGTAGYRDGPSDHAQFSDPFGIAIDGQGTIYVADAGDANAIRRITRDGTVSTLAG